MAKALASSCMGRGLTVARLTMRSTGKSFWLHVGAQKAIWVI
jgi:hypothetical protein